MEGQAATTTRLRLFDGVVYLYVDGEDGLTLSWKEVGWLDRTVYFDVPKEHWPEVDVWLEEQAEDVRTAGEDLFEQRRRY